MTTIGTITTNGITWEEKTQFQLQVARDKQKQAEDKRKEVDSEIKYWFDFANALEQTLKLYRAKQGISSNGHHINTDRLRNQSTWNSLLDISKANNGILVAVDATSILVEAGVIDEREHARNLIYSTLYSHKREAEWIREGVYRLRKRSNTNKRAPKKRSQSLKNTNSGICQVVKDIKEHNPQMTQKQVLRRLLSREFDFMGKQPGMSVNMAWIRLGYNEKGKQQSFGSLINRR